MFSDPYLAQAINPMELLEQCMADYCITAANHDNPNNHVASTFKLWHYNTESKKWALQKTPATAKQVVELIEQGYKVITGEEVYTSGNDFPTSLNFGAPIEVELRIVKNEKKYPISEMPEF